MAYFIFIVTMLCIYVRPFGLPLWIFSTLGAACAYIFGAVNLDNILLVWEITKPSTLALIGLILLSLSFEKLGFFTHLASLITPRIHPISTWKFFVFLVMLGSVVSVVFAVAASQITYLFAQQLFQLVIGFGPRAVHGVESAEGIGA